MKKSRVGSCLTLLVAAMLTRSALGADAEAFWDCKHPDKDDRCDFTASFFVGTVIDTFAATELNHYLNPQDSSILKTSWIAGVDFDYRFRQGAKSEWFVYGETVHGVHSADVNCKEDPDVPVCSDKATTDQKFLYILRNAKTLEAYAGIRYERRLSTINDNVPRFFVQTQAGFLSVAGSGEDVVDDHTYIALGLLEAGGPFSSSHLSVGWGKTDLFDKNRSKRIKIDGFLSMRVTQSDRVRPFLQMTVDSDFRSGADSVQSYFGVDVNLRRSLHF